MATSRLLSLPNEIIEQIVEEVLAFNLAPLPEASNGVVHEASPYVSYIEAATPIRIEPILYPSISALRQLVPAIHQVNQKLRVISYDVLQRPPQRCKDIGRRWGELDILMLNEWAFAVTWRSLPPRVLFPRGLDGNGYTSIMPGMTRLGSAIRRPTAEAGEHCSNNGLHIEELTLTIRATGMAINDTFDRSSFMNCAFWNMSGIGGPIFRLFVLIITRLFRYGPRFASSLIHLSQTTHDVDWTKYPELQPRVLDQTQFRAIKDDDRSYIHRGPIQMPLNTWSVGQLVVDLRQYEEGKNPLLECPHHPNDELTRYGVGREDLYFEWEASLPEITTDAEFLLTFFMLKLSECMNPDHYSIYTKDLYQSIGYIVFQLNGSEHCRKDMNAILLTLNQRTPTEEYWIERLRDTKRIHVRSRMEMGFDMSLLSDMV